MDRFIGESEKKVDFNQVCYYPTFISSRWLSVRLETVGNLIILFASLFAVLARDTMDPGLVGLSLSYALNVTGAMNLLVRMTSEIETNMVSQISQPQFHPIKVTRSHQKSQKVRKRHQKSPKHSIVNDDVLTHFLC